MKKKEFKHSLFKITGLVILIAIILTWLIPTGSFSSTGYAESVMTRIGINDLSWIFYYGAYFSLDKIFMLLAIGCFYGVLSKTPGYGKLVSILAKKFQKHETAAIIGISIVVAVLTSVFSEAFVVLIFIPFLVAILLKMGINRLGALATTFGSMIVGVMGATYGTDGLYWFNYYLGTSLTEVEPLLIRAAILVVGLVLFDFFILMYVKKSKKIEAKEENEVAGLYDTVDDSEVKVIKGKKGKNKSSIIPISIIMVIIFILCILGCVDWSSNFGIELFNDLHTTITEITIGDDFAVFSSILGSDMEAFGSWSLFTIAPVLFLFTILIAICYRSSFNEFIENICSGMCKMIKPIMVVTFAFILLVVVYMSPIIPTIMNWFIGLTDGFNLATTVISALIANIFHTDLGYTGYIMGTFLATEYEAYINPVLVIYSSLYGLVQFFIPTSMLLGVGLTTLDVKYTDWLKYVWRFLLGMFIALLVIFILITVI